MDLYIYQALGAALIFALSAMCFKWSAHGDGEENHFLLGMYLTGSSLFFISSFYGGSGSEAGVALDHFSLSAISPMMIMGGLAIGFGSAVGNYLFVKSLKLGPASLTSALAKANMLPIIAMSYFFYGEEIGLAKIIGIVFVAGALISVSMSKKADRHSTHRAWILFVLASIIFFAVRNGGLKVTNEMGFSGEIILWIAYAACAVAFLFLTVLNHKKVKFDRRALMIGMTGGCFSFSGLYLYMTALKNGPASVVVTIFSLDMVFILIMVHYLFHERLNRIQKIGFAMSLIGFIFIGL